MRILTKSQSKNLDKTSAKKYKIPESKLMDSAAKCVFDYIENHKKTFKKKPRIQASSSLRLKISIFLIEFILAIG